MPIATRGNGDRAPEWIFSAMMVSWGFYLILPFDVFSAAFYGPLKAIADERVWGAWALSIGALRMAALYINGQVRQTPIIRIAGAILGMIWWLVLTFLYTSNGPWPLPAGVAWYPVFILAEGYSALRSAGDAYVSGAFRRGPRGV